MRILVTGGLGFVGGIVSRFLLEKGHDILVVDDGRNSVSDGLVPKEVVSRQAIGGLSPDEIASFKPDVAMHFAASAMVGEGELQPMDYLQNNVTEFSWFLETLLRGGCRKIVHSGTCATYGTPQFLPLTEQHPVGPVCWYGWTKFVAEQLVAQMAKIGQLEYVGFRYFNVAGTAYGIVEQRKNEEHLIPKALDAALNGTELTVNGNDYPTDDGTCIRDYVHGLDLAAAHLAAADLLMRGQIKNEIVNLGTGIGSSVLQIIAAVEKATGRSITTKIGPRRPGDSHKLVASYEKAKKLLEWSPTRNLEEMINDAWRARQAGATVEGRP